jgi:hypothetical protein
LDRWLGHILKHREFEFIFKTNPVPDGNLGGREVVEGLCKGGGEKKLDFPCAWWYPPSMYNFIPLIAAGDSTDKEISKRGYNLILKSNFP